MNPGPGPSKIRRMAQQRLPHRGSFLSTWLFLAVAASAVTPAAASGPRLVGQGAASAVELPGGERVAVGLPAGGELTAVAALGDGWVATGTRRTATGTDLLLVADDRRGGQGVAFLPVPSGPATALRRSPVPLVAGGELAGLAWLEGQGETSLAVRFARREGEEWTRPSTVAAPGPGSQVALTAAVLADGSWLLAWARFDGADDEIVWSRSRDATGTAWTAPRPVAADNGVPDITPALVAAGRGAIAAWSRYDGEHYRVVTARFDGRAWSAPASIGPAGSLYPSWETGAAAAPVLLARTAAPRGWMLFELDAAGRPLRTAAVTANGAERPAVEADAQGALLRWLTADDQDRTARNQVRVEWARRP